jgi:hypothetical protein
LLCALAAGHLLISEQAAVQQLRDGGSLQVLQQQQQQQQQQWRRAVAVVGMKSQLVASSDINLGHMWQCATA